MGYIDAKGKKKLIWVAAVFAPTISVQLVQWFSGSGPSQAPAASLPRTLESLPAGEAPNELKPPKPLTRAQKQALAFAHSQSIDPSLKSPMDSSERVTPEVAPSPVTPVTKDLPPDPAPTLLITAIVGTRDEALASISHRLHRQGDEVAPGWRIIMIDPRSRIVRIAHTDGRTLDFSPPTND